MAVSERELRSIDEILRRNSQTILAAGVIKMFVASPDPSKKSRPEDGSFVRTYPQMSSQEWTDSKIEGACLLIYDLRSFYLGFQIWSLTSLKPKFSYEIYYDMNYRKLSPDFHCFEIDDCVLGFAFSAEPVAENFYRVAKNTMEQFKLKNPAPIKMQEFDASSVMTPKTSVSQMQSSQTAYVVLNKSKNQRKNKKEKPKKKQRNLGWRKKKQPTVNETTLTFFDDGASVATKGTGSGPDALKRSAASPLQESTKTASTMNLGTIRKGFFGLGRSRKTKNNAQTMNTKDLDKALQGQQVIVAPPKPNEARPQILSRKHKGLSMNQDGSLDLKSVSPELRKIFKEAGIRKKDLKDPNMSMVLVKELQTQEMMWAYKEQEQYKHLSAEQLSKAVENKLGDYNEYLNNLSEYESKKKKEEKKKTQMAQLMKWEEEQAPPLPARPAGPPVVAPKVTLRTRPPATSLLLHNQALLGNDRSASFSELRKQSQQGSDLFPRKDSEFSKMSLSNVGTGSFELPPPSPRAAKMASKRKELLMSGPKSSNDLGKSGKGGLSKHNRPRPNLKAPSNRSTHNAKNSFADTTTSGTTSMTLSDKEDKANNSFEKLRYDNVVPPPTPLRRMRKELPEVPKVEKQPSPYKATLFNDDEEKSDETDEFRLSQIPPPPPPIEDENSSESTPMPEPVLPNLELSKIELDVKPKETPRPLKGLTPRLGGGFLNDISNNQFNLNKVEGGLEMTLKRMKKKLTGDISNQNTLLDRLRVRIQERRQQLVDDESEDGESDSDWSVDA